MEKEKERERGRQTDREKERGGGREREKYTCSMGAYFARHRDFHEFLSCRLDANTYV